MKLNFEQILNELSSMSVTDMEDRAVYQNKLDGLYKDFTRLDFMLKRTTKDKDIMINLLNKTIEELRNQQAIVEEQAATLEDNLHKLESSYQELEQFSYIASHDLKSPLRTIASYAQLLQARYAASLDNEANVFINFIVQGARQMNSIICDLLEYSQSGRDTTFERVNLNEVLEIVRFNLKNEIEETGAKIQQPTLPTIEASKTGMILLFQNLVGNAIKFKDTDIPQIAITHDRQHNNNIFSVQDNGIGLDPKYMDKVFQPFQRISTHNRPGTGMGLAICKKVITLHGGSIWYTPVQPHGTSFHFTIAQSIAS